MDPNSTGKMLHRCSVIIPALNPDPKRLAKTIKSAVIAGCDEVVLVDDGSVVPVVPPLYPQVRVYRYSHKGISHAINKGVQRSIGDYICWLSVGDYMHPDKIEKQRLFHVTEGCRASFHDYESDTERPPPDLSRLTTDNQFCGSTTMVDRSVFTANLCWFDEHLLYCVDWDWACRVQCVAPWHHLQETLGEANEYDDGHTARANLKQRSKDRALVATRWRNESRILHPSI